LGLLLKDNETLSDFIGCVQKSSLFDKTMRDRVCGELVALARSIQPRIVVNKASNAYEAQIASNILVRYAKQHLKIEPQRLGHMCFDKCVSEAVNSGVPFVVSRPKSRISTCIADMANRLGYV
jgi:MinD-like ATPase involved in chromosome partitioning or flagellar assembly